MNKDDSFARWLKQRCRELGISVDQLRRLLLYSVSSIEKVLRGELPSRGFVQEVAELFAIPDDRFDAFLAWAQGERTEGEAASPETGEEALDQATGGSTSVPWGAPAVSSTKGMRVFICHASEDKPAVRDLYFRLRAAGFAPWLDEENLLPGQDWTVEIRKAVRGADVVLVCLSRKAVTKSGYVQKELGFALDVAEEQPEGTIFLIPVRLEECEVPERLKRWQWVDIFSLTGTEWRGYRKLISSLHERAQAPNRAQ